MELVQKKTYQYYLGFHLPLHILWISCLFYLPINLPLALLFYILFFVFGIQIGYHRLFAHKAFTPKYAWMKYLFAILGTGALLSGPVSWAQFHRYHHAFSDTEKDPQNIMNGRWYAHYGWLFNVTPLSPMVIKDLLRDKVLLIIEKNRITIPIVFLILCLYVNIETFMSCLTGMILACQIDMSINSLIGHSPKKGLKNNAFLSIFTAGTSLHKNHHHNASSYNFGTKWYEIDPCKYIVPLLAKK